MAAQPAADREADARLEMEAAQEEAAINTVCQSLSLEMHEVRQLAQSCGGPNSDIKDRRYPQMVIVYSLR